MLTLMLAALTTVHSAAPMTSAPATVHPIAIVAEPARSAEHIARARKALETGDLAEARREFVIATALDRDEGKLPVESSFGLAQVLFSQAQDTQAGRVLEQLADDAQHKGDLDTEAHARVDAIWLNLNAKDAKRARLNAERLQVIRGDARLSKETRTYIDKRVR